MKTASGKTAQGQDRAHTPGPWKFVQGHVVYGADGFGVAELQRTGFAEHIANARLIAAAPDLLAALEWHTSCKGIPDFDGSRARSAIAKARGQ